MVLRSADADPRNSQVYVHNFPDHGETVCSKSGIVEPVTMAMFRFLHEQGSDADDWIDEAVKRNSLPLIGRISLALHEMASDADQQLVQWSDQVLKSVIDPAFSSFPFFRC